MVAHPEGKRHEHLKQRGKETFGLARFDIDWKVEKQKQFSCNLTSCVLSGRLIISISMRGMLQIESTSLTMSYTRNE